MDREKSSARTKFLGPISTKTAIKFFCLFVLVYVLLMAAWPAVGSVYSKFYRAVGEFLFGSFGRGSIVRFSQSDDNKDDIYITVFNRYRVDENGRMQGAWANHSIRYNDYIHTAFLMALIVAVPLPLRRKVWSIVYGMILIHAFVIFKLAIMILNLFSKERVALLILNSFWKNVVVITNEVLMRRMTTGFIIAFFIWILVSFRREDWSRIQMQKPKEAQC
jgi:hypothetical protein